MANDSDDPSRSTPPSGPGPGNRTAPRSGLLYWMRTVLGMENAGSIRSNLQDALNAEPDAESTAEDFSPEEREMLKNILALRELSVEDVMVPRADILAVADDVTLTELLSVFDRAEHSRLPVYGETLDEPRGMVLIKDLVHHLMAQAATRGASDADTRIDFGKVDFTVSLADSGLVRPVLYVPTTMPAVVLLAKMQASRIHLALVIDEYGGTDGLVTIENLVETIVGDIEDEHDDDDGPAIHRTVDGSFVADARIGIEEAIEAVGPDLEQISLDEDVETLGGLLVTLAGRVPGVGETIAMSETLAFEVLDGDPRRVKRIAIRHVDGASAVDGAQPAPVRHHG